MMCSLLQNIKLFTFRKMLGYIDNFLDQKRVFNPEYLLYCFVKNNGFKIKLAHKFAIELYGLNTKTHNNNDLQPGKKHLFFLETE